MYHPVKDHLISPAVPKSSDMITPVKTIPKTFHNWAAGSGGKIFNRDMLVMNSTAQCSEENSPNIPCELSSINATAEVTSQDKADSMLKSCNETPAKIFARMKAKVQRLNSVGHGADHVRNKEICGGIPFDPVVQFSQKSKANQETYVVDLSPPKLPGGDTQAGEMDLPQESHSIDFHEAPGRLNETLNTQSRSFIEPYVLLEKMPAEVFSDVKAMRMQMPENLYNRKPYMLLDKVVPDETFARLQQKPINYQSGNRGGCVVFGERSISMEKNSEEDLQNDASNTPESGQFECAEVVPGPPQPFHNLLEDPLLQLSPRVLIPRKQVSVLQLKQQARQAAVVLDEGTNVRGIHLKDWVLKLLNKDLVVDGIRVDTMIPWHSSFIIERISSNVLKTSSGRTYVLIGKMARHPNSSFPSWFLKKFLFGFPKMWKEYLDQFLSDHIGSQKSQEDDSSAKAPKARNQQASKKSTSKHPKIRGIVTSPNTPTDSILPGSAKVSRSGRLIKPPLEYWKGGRIVMDYDMNVTILEDYSTSLLSTPKKPETLVTSQITQERSLRPERGKRNTYSREDELSVPMRRLKQHSKPQRNAPSQSIQIESTTLNKPTRAQKGPLVVAPSSIQAVKQTASQPQRASLRKQQFGGEEITLGSGAQMTENTNVDAVNANFSLVDGGMSRDKQETSTENDSKTKLNRKSSHKNIQDEPHSIPLCRSYSLRSSDGYSPDSNSSLVSPDPPKRQRGKVSTNCKRITKPHKIETAVPQDSTSHNKQNKKGLRRPKKISQKNSDDDLAGDSIDFPIDDDDDDDDEEERRQHKKATPLLKKTRERNGKSELLINGHQTSSEDMDSEYPEDEESVQHAVSNNRRSKKSETGKVNTRSKKPQTKNGKTNEQDELLDGKWTEEELQKLHEGVNSFPKHKRGYWANVAYVVGTRSAEECQEQYNDHQQTNKRPRKRASMKPAATEEPEKKMVEITAKAGTLKRRQQMRHFLDHMPKDDHDDVFTSSPMHNRQIKVLLPVFAENGDEDFSQLQNPQTPSSSICTIAKTPQCLHISPGMLGSINKNNMDKYIFHLQKKQKGKKRSKKAAAMDKLTPTPAVKKTLKRCVAEDDDFVVWNMLSDKDIPSRSDDSDKEDDYFMEYC